uniref:Large ribosomal subunit protein uL13c n=1 Tax=Boldia erythrosiphon TaxID=74908 RepID=A0A1X9PV68_9RHOD|nr:50S ribosomal protein L13 [Boldia erythrosiphon]ARO90603.1 50S ribosomal protein L13 [Boldia erythrosiphon]
MNKTFLQKLDITPKKWYLIDADGKILGRLASSVVNILTGKNKTLYSPNLDMGDNVIIINSRKINTTGNKEDQKRYYNHSGRPGGLKIESLSKLRTRIPNRIIEKAVKGMLPKGRLGRQLFTHLKVYADSHHCHDAQQPEIINL